MALSKTAGAYEMILVGRIIVGFAGCLATTIAPAYVVEICVPKVKPTRTIALMCQLIQSFAVFCTYVMGFDEFLGTEELWPYLLGFPVVICGVQLLLLIPFCPESPRYLLMKKDAPEDARKAYQLIRGREDVEADIKELIKELEQSKLEPHVSVIQLITTPVLRRSLIVAILFGWYQNWCGIRGILVFSTKLFQDIGMAERDAKYATSGTGLILFLSNLLGPYMVANFRHKLLNYIGSIGMGTCCVIVALTTAFSDEVEFLKYVNVGASLSFIAFWSVGPVCLFWVIVVEIFPHSARGAGLGLAVQAIFLAYFVYCYAFPEMLLALHGYTFFVEAGINALMVVFIRFVIPETKHKSQAETFNLPESTTSHGELSNNKVSGLESKQREVELTRF